MSWRYKYDGSHPAQQKEGYQDNDDYPRYAPAYIYPNQHQHRRSHRHEQHIRESPKRLNIFSGQHKPNLSSPSRRRNNIFSSYGKSDQHLHSQPNEMGMAESRRRLNIFSSHDKSDQIKKSDKRIEKMQKRRQKMDKLSSQECPVCSAEIIGAQLEVLFSSCGHKFCRRCLSEQILDSLQDFKLARCLSDGCSAVLQFQSPHIRSLSVPQQQKYYNAAVFANMAANPELRLCPRQDCEGFIDTKEIVAKCAICKIVFCRKCLMPEHRRECDENGVQFVEGNYKFKKCERCKMVLEKNQGCDHMTCRCGYQFCYKCGRQWSGRHSCNQPGRESQQIIEIQNPNPRRIIIPIAESLELPSQEIHRSAAIILALERSAPLHSGQRSICQSCKKTFKKFLNILTVVLVFMCLEVLWTVLLLTVGPIICCFILLCLSLKYGAEDMKNRLSCRQIVIGNIFLYLFCVGHLFCSEFYIFFKDTIWNKIWNVRILLPITSRIWEAMDD